MAAAHSTAAMRPPRIAVTRGSVPGPIGGRRPGPAGSTVIPSAFAPGAFPVPSRRPSIPLRFFYLGQDAPHLDGRSYAVGTQACPSGRAPSSKSSSRAAAPRRPTSRRPCAPRPIPPTRRVEPTVALAEALSALDRAAKAGAIHPNAAARRKSRLTRKVNAALGGASVQTAGHITKSTGKAAAQKAAKARIAAGKADKAKGAQTAAGKARAALSKTARAEAAAAKAAEASAAAAAPAKAAPKTGDQGRAEGQGDRHEARPRRPRLRRPRPRPPPRPRRRRRRPPRSSRRRAIARRDPPHERRLGHRPGRFAYPAACGLRSGAPPHRSRLPGCASVGFGRNAPYSPPPSRLPTTVNTSTMPAVPNCSFQ